MQIHTAEFETSASNLEQCPPEGLPEFAFVGRSNVGKSSLINMLSGQKKDIAIVSSTPGRTRLINFFNINKKWKLIDLPGYGYAKISKEADKAKPGAVRRNQDAFLHSMSEWCEGLPKFFTTSSKNRDGRRDILNFVDAAISNK